VTDRPVCPRREHRVWGATPLPLDRIPADRGGGWDCPGVAPDGSACGYETGTAAAAPAGMTDDALAAAAAIAYQMFLDGIAEGLRLARDPEAGYDTGFDVGFSAQQDDRPYVHAVIRGFEDGTAARHAWCERLTDRDREQARRRAAAARQLPRPDVTGGADGHAEAAGNITPR